MKTTQILMNEHQVILKELSELNSLLKQDHLENHKLLRSIGFIQEYADNYHHAKEEEIYFKWMIEKNPSFKNGPIHCMLDEHDKGRIFI